MSDHKKEEFVSCMAKVMAITAIPTRRIDTDGIPTRTRKYYRQPGRGHNHDLCDSCHEGGDLLCCDTCPASFHLVCVNPPLQDENIPAGEWRCQKCVADKPQKGAKKAKAQKKKEEDMMAASALPGSFQKIFIEISRDLKASNSRILKLDKDLTTIPPLAGDEKTTTKDRTRSKKKGAADKKKLAPTDLRKCFYCRKSDFVGNLKGCDFCPQFFHRDCFDVPIAPKKEVLWMCPLHVENFIDDVLVPDNAMSKRLHFRNIYCNEALNHNAIQLEFERKVECLKFYPQLRSRKVNDSDKVMEVPDFVNDLYEGGRKFPRFNIEKWFEKGGVQKQTNDGVLTKCEKKGDLNSLLEAAEKLQMNDQQAAQMLLEFAVVAEQQGIEKEKSLQELGDSMEIEQTFQDFEENKMEMDIPPENEIIVMIDVDNLSKFNFEMPNDEIVHQIGNELLASDKKIVVINIDNAEPKNDTDQPMEAEDISM